MDSGQESPVLPPVSEYSQSPFLTNPVTDSPKSTTHIFDRTNIFEPSIILVPPASPSITRDTSAFHMEPFYIGEMEDRKDSSTLEDVSIRLGNMNLEKRSKIAQEIIETERNYVNSLALLIEVFYKPFNEKALEPESCITPNDVKSIFSCIEIIFSYNREFLKDLERVIENWNPSTSKLGSTFATISHFLKTYMTYVSNYTVALRTLEQCKKDDTFDELLTDLELNHKLKNMPLTGFLIMPVQRIPRYLLLLKELLKYTPESHVDFKDLVIAYDKITSVANEVNEAERNAENLNTIYSIQTLLSGQIETILEPHRKLVKHGQIDIIIKQKRKIGYLILFNDMIILTKQKGATTILYNPFGNKPSKAREEYFEQGTTLKVILQSDLSKFQFEIEHDQFKISTPKKNYYRRIYIAQRFQRLDIHFARYQRKIRKTNH